MKLARGEPRGTEVFVSWLIIQGCTPKPWLLTTALNASSGHCAPGIGSSVQLARTLCAYPRPWYLSPTSHQYPERWLVHGSSPSSTVCWEPHWSMLTFGPLLCSTWARKSSRIVSHDSPSLKPHHHKARSRWSSPPKRRGVPCQKGVSGMGGAQDLSEARVVAGI